MLTDMFLPAPVPRKKEGRAARLAAMMEQDATGATSSGGEAEVEAENATDPAENGSADAMDVDNVQSPPRTRKPPKSLAGQPLAHFTFVFWYDIEAFRRPCLPCIGNGFNLLFLICNSVAFAFTRETEQGSDILAFYDTLTAGKAAEGHGWDRYQGQPPRWLWHIVRLFSQFICCFFYRL